MKRRDFAKLFGSIEWDLRRAAWERAVRYRKRSGPWTGESGVTIGALNRNFFDRKLRERADRV